VRGQICDQSDKDKMKIGVIWLAKPRVASVAWRDDFSSCQPATFGWCGGTDGEAALQLGCFDSSLLWEGMIGGERLFDSCDTFNSLLSETRSIFSKKSIVHEVMW
jgi:hypothetical protein